ncbi:MAG: hypothetical protein ACI8WT_003552 [Clostridium sp.]
MVAVEQPLKILKLLLHGLENKLLISNQQLDILHNDDLDNRLKWTWTLQYTVIGIYSCDIVFLNSLNENIAKQIARDGVEIYSKVSR